MASTKKNFRVTDKAGAYVAGKKVKAGDVLQLTEEEARYLVLSGEVETEAKPSREPASKPSKAAPKEDKKAD